MDPLASRLLREPLKSPAVLVPIRWGPARPPQIDPFEFDFASKDPPLTRTQPGGVRSLQVNPLDSPPGTPSLAPLPPHQGWPSSRTPPQTRPPPTLLTPRLANTNT
eukprot:1110003-Prorocentrum_minimum.AAC.1